MAEQTFGPGELLVVAEGDTVDFSVQVHGRAELRHDEVRDLIAFLQDIVDAEQDVYAGSTLLVKNYGPITAKDGVCSSRHADKTETGDTP